VVLQVAAVLLQVVLLQVVLLHLQVKVMLAVLTIRVHLTLVVAVVVVVLLDKLHQATHNQAQVVLEWIHIQLGLQLLQLANQVAMQAAVAAAVDILALVVLIKVQVD
jgi:hypothetical protein